MARFRLNQDCMNPILAAGVSSIAGQLVSRLTGGTPTNPASHSATSFKQTLAGILNPGAPATNSASELKQKLLESPEVRDALRNLDLTQITSLELTSNGTLAAVSPRGRVEIALSEGTKTVARNLFTQEALNRATKLAADSGAHGISPQTPVSIALPTSARKV
jgi:hypothetical protein